MSTFTKTTLLVALLSFLFARCYYDNETKLYPDSINCKVPASPSFATDVLPLLNTRCNNCHGGSSPSGGIKLDTYTDVSTYVKSGSLMGSINQTSGYSPMPKGGSKMSACDINKIQNWITSGAYNN
jgi:hypothetical protein